MTDKYRLTNLYGENEYGFGMAADPPAKLLFAADSVAPWGGAYGLPPDMLPRRLLDMAAEAALTGQARTEGVAGRAAVAQVGQHLAEQARQPGAWDGVSDQTRAWVERAIAVNLAGVRSSLWQALVSVSGEPLGWPETRDILRGLGLADAPDWFVRLYGPAAAAHHPHG